MNYTSPCLAFYFCALPRNCAIVISVLRFSWHPRQFIPPPHHPPVLQIRTLLPAERRLTHLLHRDFVFEVVGIEGVDSSVGGFGLRIHEIDEGLLGGSG